MKRALVMTVIGPDRPGLVESVADLVVRHGGNWLESRMSRLGGHFAGILRVEVPPAREAQLAGDLKKLEACGLVIVVHSDTPPGAAVPGSKLMRLDLVGQDRPGIVRQISSALARHHVNVEELETDRASAAMSGETLFTARARLSIPSRCDLEKLRHELETIAADLIVELTLENIADR